MKVASLFTSFILLIMLSVSPSIADEAQPWQRFYDEKSNLYGFKGQAGKVRVPPKFVMVDAHQFNNIAAVIEQVDEETFKGYYLLKNGKKVGQDHLYMSGNYLDCECEEKIRFRDKKLDQVGFLDKNGNTVVPAAYSDATPFRNNMAVVLKGAIRICPDGSPYDPEKMNCEHFKWEGGRSYLINSKNQVLVEDFKYTTDLDWLSLNISQNEPVDPLREPFQGVNGKYYSFINVEKEFKQWLLSDFFKSTDTAGLHRNTFKEITYWHEGQKKWVRVGKVQFFKNNELPVSGIVNALKESKQEWEIHKNSMGMMMLSDNDIIRHARYFDSCLQAKTWRYPMFDVVITHYSNDSEKKFLYQDIFQFLKSDKGYKLVALSIKSVQLK